MAVVGLYYVSVVQMRMLLHATKKKNKEKSINCQFIDNIEIISRFYFASNKMKMNQSASQDCRKIVN